MVLGEPTEDQARFFAHMVAAQDVALARSGLERAEPRWTKQYPRTTKSTT